ncbi:MAG TPA: ABC transporter ATP-binding protein [Syntrophomonadaceae bacterium]|nr:ABC transporter ATP-binding protein [Syntrophomonadaceae bacterium]
MQALLEMLQISKSFPGVQANRKIDLHLLPGEIHALLGENGAGKTTLMNILAGMYRPDSGEILLRGQAVAFSSPQDALDQGIGMIYQHLMLVPGLTVAENVVLGSLRESWWLRRSRFHTAVQELIEKYGFHLNPEQKVANLSLGEQQRVEILRALYRHSDVLILDEPTAVLTPGEARELFAILRLMADEGRAVILITHKLNEVIEIADRVTVLRRGQVVDSRLMAGVDNKTLTRMMIGQETWEQEDHPARQAGSAVLKLDDFSVRGDRGEMAVKRINLEVKSGEMLAIAGVAGNGQNELLQALAGLRPIFEGQMLLSGQPAGGRSVRDLLQSGVRFIPEDRIHTGLVGSLGVSDNVILRDYFQDEYIQGMRMKWGRIRRQALELVEQFQIQCSDPDRPARLLSGGNLQRLMLARELQHHPRLLLAAYPTRGLDVGAVDNIHELLNLARREGTAILTVMEDLEEILQIADRVTVMYNGMLSPALPVTDVSLEQVGQWMAGIGLDRIA